MTAEIFNQSLKVNIAGKDFFVACEQSERKNLLEAARITNDEIIKNRGDITASNSVPVETAAVLAALNLAGELVSRDQSDNDLPAADQSELIDRLIQQLDDAIRG